MFILHEEIVQPDGTKTFATNQYTRSMLNSTLRNYHSMTYANMMELLKLLPNKIIRTSPTHRYVILPMKNTYSLEEMLNIINSRSAVDSRDLFGLAGNEREYVIIDGVFQAFIGNYQTN